MSRVGIVGTGAMGRPVIDRLLAAGHSVAAHARRPEVAAELTAAGVEVVGSLPELGRDRDVVLVYVYSDEQVREVTLDSGLLDAMAPDALVVVHTTGSPATVEAIAAVHPAVIDAAASGGPASIAAGTLTVFLGGADEHVERFRPVLECYAEHAVHFGPLGAGQRVKLLNNLLFGAHVQLAVEAARVAGRSGSTSRQVARTLHTGSGQSYALDLVAASGSAEALLQGAGPYIRKDAVVARRGGGRPRRLPRHHRQGHPPAARVTRRRSVGVTPTGLLRSARPGRGTRGSPRRARRRASRASSAATTRFTAATARGSFAAICSATASARSSAVPSGTTSLTNPRASMSAAPKRAPVSSTCIAAA